MKTKPINITLPTQNYCTYKLELQIYDDHTCIYAEVTYNKNPKVKYKIKFNSEWISEERIEWLGNILLNNIIAIVYHAERNTINSLSLPIQEFKRLINL